MSKKKMKRANRIHQKAIAKAKGENEPKGDRFKVVQSAWDRQARMQRAVAVIKAGCPQPDESHWVALSLPSELPEYVNDKRYDVCLDLLAFWQAHAKQPIHCFEVQPSTQAVRIRVEDEELTPVLVQDIPDWVL